MSIIASASSAVGNGLETLVVLAIVAAFAWRGLRQLLPSTHQRLVRALRRLFKLPAAAVPDASGDCNSGCGSCNNCGTPASSPPKAEAPLHFRPRKP